MRLSLVLTVFAVSAVSAQISPPPAIRDNSFLVEEAYNQEKGIVQHINTFSTRKLNEGWGYSFTQEWPVRSMRHQFSYTIPVAHDQFGSFKRTGLGDILLNYRYQAVGANGEPTAFAPRLSLVLPTGNVNVGGANAAGAGLQTNLPVSFQFGPIVSHTNLGATVIAISSVGDDVTKGFSAGQSFIWLAHPKINFMLEGVWSRMEREVEGPIGTTPVLTFTDKFISPGVRGAIDFESGLQVVPGIAVPIALGGNHPKSIFVYLSFEHPFTKNR